MAAMMANLRDETELTPRYSQALEGQPRSLGISYHTLQRYLRGRDQVELVNQNERKRKMSNATGTNLSVESSSSKRRLSTTDSPDVHSTYAVRSFPPEVRLCRSSIPGVEFGVCAKQHIPSGTWIGPFEGKRLEPEDLTPDVDTSYIWEIHENGRLSHYIDGNDENSSSWMRFIGCARYPEEQNMYAFQFCGSIFYRAYKDINMGTELLVWYDAHYPQFIGIPLGLKDIQLISSLGVREAHPQKNGPALPELPSCRFGTGEDNPVHQPSFSPVEEHTENEDGITTLVSPPSGAFADVVTEMYQAPTTPKLHHFQNPLQPPQQETHLFPQHQLHQQSKIHSTQNHSTWKLHHPPKRQQPHEKHPENIRQQHKMQQHFYQQQQQGQPQHQEIHQNRQNNQPRSPQHHQHHYRQQNQQPPWPESSSSANSGGNFGKSMNGFVNHSARLTVPPLRSISQHEMSRQQTSLWPNRSFRFPAEVYPQYKGQVLEPQSSQQPTTASTNHPQSTFAIVGSAPDNRPRNTMPHFPHPLKSAHVKPFHVNKCLESNETTESRERSTQKPFAPPEFRVPGNQGHQDGDVRRSGKGNLLPGNEALGKKMVKQRY